MKKYSAYIYLGILAINIAFATYLINGWLFAKPIVPEMPSNLLTENDLIKSEILKLNEASEDNQIGIALMSSKVDACSDSKIVDIFRAIRKEKPVVKLYVLFSEYMSDQDIQTFKENFKLDFEIRRMSSELDEYWEKTSQKYKTPAIIILKNQNKMFASQNVPEIKKVIEGF